ncbi:hypothetical protein [Clostridium sp. AWRP]|uniref:hypothetical protein n=1 Tax=Clostridium sp. AWRP TaxID=2212991 RepID=UPI000FD827D4|nr:hypothetical protein [Clostridium sp. AWRP]AZV57918.1 hypothetical protein DMR38_15610 [Clostridium sp. AWRP]
MKKTANYGLKKPEGTDVVDIQNFNDNADIIDAELKKRALNTQIPTVPVKSVNSKTGAVTLSASDIKAADGATLEAAKGKVSSHMADTTAHGIGDKTKLNTTAKNTIVAAINEVFQSGTSVKSSTISAVNSKGQSLSTTSTWDQIIAAINSIARGQGNAVESQVLSGVDFSNADGKLRHGTMPNNGAINITPSGSAHTIPAGYTSGGSVSAVSVPVANVLSGTTIAGQVGTMPDYSNTTDQIMNYPSCITKIDNLNTDGDGVKYGVLHAIVNINGHVNENTEIQQRVNGLNPAVIKAGHSLGKPGLLTGTFTSDATATIDDIVSDKTAYVNGNKIVGTGNKAKRFVSGTVTADSQGNFVIEPNINITVAIISFTSIRGLKITGILIIPNRFESQFFIGSDGKVYSGYSVDIMQGRIRGWVDANVDVEYKIYE